MDPTLKEIADYLRGQCGNRLKQVLFFGSRARGDASAESDYDCLLIFDQVSADLKANVDSYTAELLLKRGILLSCVVLTETDLERFRYEPFLQNARREGVAA